MALLENQGRNYRFLPGIAPYSSGVVAMAGYEIVHVTLRRLPYWRDGFALIQRHLREEGLPPQALCAVGLRSPSPLTFEGFAGFNEEYQRLLFESGLLVEGQNPVARTNVAPEQGAPPVPSLYSFAYASPWAESQSDSFVVAGAGELGGGELSARAIVRAGETSPEAMREKAAVVMDTMEDRLARLGVGWRQVTRANLYTVHAIEPLVRSKILGRMGEAALRGVHWYVSRPPILGLEFEMDVRGVRREVML